MALTVTDRPYGWSAALNPVAYKFQRKDAGFNQVNNNGGFAQFQINGVDLTAFFVVTNSLYVKSSVDFDDFTTVTASAFSGGNTLVTTGLAYLAGDGGTSGDFLNNLTQRTNHKVSIDIYDSTTNEVLFDAPFTFSSNSRGYILADVQVLKTILSPDLLSLPAEDAQVLDSNKYQGFYIKYTEQWTGSAESETSDSANSRFAAFAQLPVLGNNDMLTRIPNGWLTLFDETSMFIGNYFDISYFGVSAGLTIVIQRYLGGEFISITSLTSAIGINRLALSAAATEDEIILNIVEESKVLRLDDADDWTVTIGTFDSVTTTTFTETFASATAVQAIQDITAAAVPEGAIIRISITIEITGTWTGNVNVQLTLNGGSIVAPAPTQNFTVNGSYTQEWIWEGGGSNTSIDLTIETSSWTGSAVVAVTIPNGSAIYVSGGSENTYPHTINVLSSCARPVTVGWTNSKGGSDWWTFDFNQEVSFNYGSYKARRLNLFAKDLSLNQWEVINGLNTIGELYSPSIPELTSSVKGTQKRIDQQVYLRLDDGTLLEVIVIPTGNVTFTEQAKHNLQILIELPVGFVGSGFLGMGDFNDDFNNDFLI